MIPVSALYQRQPKAAQVCSRSCTMACPAYPLQVLSLRRHIERDGDRHQTSSSLNFGYDGCVICDGQCQTTARYVPLVIDDNGDGHDYVSDCGHENAHVHGGYDCGDYRSD